MYNIKQNEPKKNHLALMESDFSTMEVGVFRFIM